MAKKKTRVASKNHQTAANRKRDKERATATEVVAKMDTRRDKVVQDSLTLLQLTFAIYRRAAELWFGKELPQALLDKVHDRLREPLREAAAKGEGIDDLGPLIKEVVSECLLEEVGPVVVKDLGAGAIL